ncbi:MAG TPA: PIN domain-containing protein [Chloroflexota bacterium]|nr:PIN domain-containing protein [Chloroflexota bacterium]
MALIDTNVLLRHLLQDHADHSPRATALLQRVERGELRVDMTATVVFETVFVLDRRARLPRAAIRDAVLPIVELPAVLLPGKQLVREAFEFYVRLNIPFADAYHAAVGRALDPPRVIAFDRHFNRVPGLVRIEP